MSTPGPDTYDIRKSAAIILEAHVPASDTGCCRECGRSTLPDGCDAPEVREARLQLQPDGHEYRVPGVNHQGMSYA